MHRSGTSRLRWPARPRSFGIALAVLAIATSAVACGGAATSSDGVGVDRAAYPNAMVGGDGSFARVVKDGCGSAPRTMRHTTVGSTGK